MDVVAAMAPGGGIEGTIAMVPGGGIEGEWTFAFVPMPFDGVNLSMTAQCGKPLLPSHLKLALD